MTEVRPAPRGGLGLFATQEFRVGDVVISEEAPLLDLSALTVEEEIELRSQFSFLGNNGNKKNNTAGAASTSAATIQSTTTAATPSFRETIRDIPKEIDAHDRNIFRGLVHMGAWYATFASANKLTPNKTTSMLGLYAPDLDQPSSEEVRIVQLARHALQYLRTKCKDGTPVQAALRDEDKAEDVLQCMLVWACNAFEGGRIYNRHSRINHSCNPNAIVQVPEEDAAAAAKSTTGARGSMSGRQLVQAAAPIAIGDEITVSYLGTLLYSDTAVRQTELQRTKHFLCRCDRCSQRHCVRVVPDTAASLPCLGCHPRHGRVLDEDTQYDDDKNVCYMIPVSSPQKDPVAKDDVDPVDLNAPRGYASPKCRRSFEPSNRELVGALTTVRAVSERVANYLRTRQEEAATGADDEEGDNGDGDAAARRMLLEEHTSLASSVCGAMHWTTNLLLLLQLDQQLQDHHRWELLRHTGVASASNPNDDFDAEDDAQDAGTRIATCADLLERLVRYVDELGLRLHRSRLLFGVSVGLARALVGMGDPRSKAYARQWLERIDPGGAYAAAFETKGMQKVAAALRQSGNDAPPKRRGGGDDDQTDRPVKQVKKGGALI